MVEGVPVALETEVVAKAQRRRFTAAEKLRVLRQADGCAKPGELSGVDLLPVGAPPRHADAPGSAQRPAPLGCRAACRRSISFRMAEPSGLRSRAWRSSTRAARCASSSSPSRSETTP